MLIIGGMVNTSGTIAIAPMIEPLWRYSRISLVTMAPMRRLLSAISGRPRPLIDELEVHVLERVHCLGDRQHVGSGGHQGPGDGGRGDRRVDTEST